MSTKTITVTYFKHSGKYYSEGSYLTRETLFHKVVDEVIGMFKRGESPGLTHDSMRRNHFDVIMSGEDFPPHLIRAHDVCECDDCLAIRTIANRLTR